MFRRRKTKHTPTPKPIYTMEATPTEPNEFDRITNQHPVEITTKTNLPAAIQLQLLMGAVEQLTNNPDGFPHPGLAELARETRELIELHIFTRKDTQ